VLEILLTQPFLFPFHHVLHSLDQSLVHVCGQVLEIPLTQPFLFPFHYVLHSLDEVCGIEGVEGEVGEVLVHVGAQAGQVLEILLLLYLDGH